MVDEAKRWFESSTVICRFVPDGKTRAEKVSTIAVALHSIAVFLRRLMLNIRRFLKPTLNYCPGTLPVARVRLILDALSGS